MDTQQIHYLITYTCNNMHSGCFLKSLVLQRIETGSGKKCISLKLYLLFPSLIKHFDNRLKCQKPQIYAFWVFFFSKHQLYICQVNTGIYYFLYSKYLHCVCIGHLTWAQPLQSQFSLTPTQRPAHTTSHSTHRSSVNSQ